MAEKDIQNAIYGVSGITWLLGMFGNIALIAIYSKKNLNLRFNKLMITLAIFDLSYLTVHMCLFINSVTLGVTSVTHMIFGFLGYCAFKGSAFTTIAISLERYLILCKDRYFFMFC